MFNKQNKNQIDYCDYTWNPIRCKCRHDCEYCYMTSLYNRFPDIWTDNPELIDDFEKDVKKLSKMKPSIIFVGSSTDIFGAWIPDSMIQQIINVCQELKQHRFLFLTKNPIRYFNLDFPDNCFCGETADTKTRVLNYFIKHFRNIENIRYIMSNYFVSFEPLLEDVENAYYYYNNTKWIIIGADSRKGAKNPEKVWIENIINQARKYNIPVWIKNNIGYEEFLNIKEIPKELML